MGSDDEVRVMEKQSSFTLRAILRNWIGEFPSGFAIEFDFNIEKTCREIDGRIEELRKEVYLLNKHIEQMSCCCAGCTKHNLSIEVDDGQKIGDEL